MTVLRRILRFFHKRLPAVTLKRFLRVMAVTSAISMLALFLRAFCGAPLWVLVGSAAAIPFVILLTYAALWLDFTKDPPPPPIQNHSPHLTHVQWKKQAGEQRTKTGFLAG